MKQGSSLQHTLHTQNMRTHSPTDGKETLLLIIMVDGTKCYTLNKLLLKMFIPKCLTSQWCLREGAQTIDPSFQPQSIKDSSTCPSLVCVVLNTANDKVNTLLCF